MRNAFAALAVLFTVTLHAQSAREASLQAIPHSSDVFLLSPGAPTASRSIVIDNTRRVDIMVTALSQELDVMLISPRNQRYSIGQTKPGFESWISPVENLGANYRAIMTDPAPGTWTLQVTAKKLAADLDVIVNTFFESEIFAALVAADTEYRIGDVAAASLAVFEGSTRLRALQLAAHITPPAGGSTPVTFRDDGSEADATANDGVYTAIVLLPVEGEFQIHADIRGTGSSGPFRRTASARLRAQKVTATLGGSFLEAAADTDSDGLLDFIIISPAVNVAEAARYSVSVRLRSSAGRILQKDKSFELSAGQVNPELRFEGKEVREVLAADGPFQVEMLLLERYVPGDRVFVDRKSEVGLTDAYRLVDLQRDRLRFTGPVTATGIDANGNGLYEQLKVDVEFETDVAGAYFCSASLTDSDRNILGDRSEEAALVSGKNRITYLFDGQTIGERAVDGSFTVGFHVSGPTEKLGGAQYFTVGPFSIKSFEQIPDTTPPTILVTMSPHTLWPVDHKMVEVIPNLQVQDERDPSPAVRLESVIVSEGPNDIGDLNTSPDIRIENGRIWLRAERSGKSTNRYYRIKWSAKDRAGNNTEATAFVIVPHDQGH